MEEEGTLFDLVTFPSNSHFSHSSTWLYLQTTTSIPFAATIYKCNDRNVCIWLQKLLSWAQSGLWTTSGETGDCLQMAKFTKFVCVHLGRPSDRASSFEGLENIEWCMYACKTRCHIEQDESSPSIHQVRFGMWLFFVAAIVKNRAVAA